MERFLLGHDKTAHFWHVLPLSKDKVTDRQIYNQKMVKMYELI